MVQTFFIRIVWLFSLVLIQVLILNNVNLFGLITPYIYVYFLLNEDIKIPRNISMLWAFSCGILIDIFSDTPGINAASSVFLSFIRIYILRLFVSHDMLEQGIPMIRTIGFPAYLKYILLSVLIHHSLVVMLCYFSLSSIGYMMLRILLSTLFTSLLIIIDNTRR